MVSDMFIFEYYLVFFVSVGDILSSAKVGEQVKHALNPHFGECTNLMRATLQK